MVAGRQCIGLVARRMSACLVQEAPVGGHALSALAVNLFDGDGAETDGLEAGLLGGSKGGCEGVVCTDEDE